MRMRYLLIDAANTFWRARHTAFRGATAWDRVGLAIHVTFASVNKCWREQSADHVVFCFEGRSWRKDYDHRYKANRTEDRAAASVEEQEELQLCYEALNNMQDYLREKTNCTVLQHEQLEADDLIAGWIQSHPDDHHTIISSDTDFVQLIAPNVVQYNGIAKRTIALDGITDDKGKIVIDKKTGLPVEPPEPEWELFKKCMRGDPTDNVFSAYPGVREKGTSKKVGLREAFADRNSKGYNWNNMMLQKWVDHNGKEIKVLDAYHANRTLIDLAAQPDDIKVLMGQTIAAGQVKKDKPMIGAQFLKFCGKFELVKLSEQANTYINFLSAPYKGE